MDNPEEVLHCLDEFAKLKPKDIPRELEDYLMYVARTGDPVYQWPLVKCLFREKLLSVITEFYETTPTLDLPPSPNVDPFNYENMKRVLLERLEAFSNAPFTVQRLCELLTTPRKEYNRPDKFMRAIEKNILVVSTREPGLVCRPDSALSEPLPNGVSENTESANIKNITDDSVVEAAPSTQAEETAENHVTLGMLPEEKANHIDTEPTSNGSAETLADELRESATKDEDASEATECTSSANEGVVSCSSKLEETVEEVPGSALGSSDQPDSVESTENTVVTPTSPQPADAALLASSTTREPDAEGSSSTNALPETTDRSDPTTDSSVNSKNEVEESPVCSLSPSKESVSNNDIKEVCEQDEGKEDISVAKVVQEVNEHPVVEEKNLEESCPQAEDSLDSAPESSDIAPTSVEPDTLEASTKISDVEPPVSTAPTEEATSSEITSDVTVKTETHTLKVENVSENVVETGVADSSDSVTGPVDSCSADVKKVQETACVISSKEVISVNQTNEEEAMEVDESSNQLPEAGEAEAMAVTEEAEPMDDSEQTTVEEMS